MKLSDFKKLKLKHGDPVVIIWDDIIEHSNYNYKPGERVKAQIAKFIVMGWVVALDGDKFSFAIEPEYGADGSVAGEHPFRTMQIMSVGDIYSIARLPKPKKWYY